MRRRWVDLLRGTVDVAEIVVEVRGELYVGTPKTRAGCRTVGLLAVRAAGLAPLRPHDLRHTAVALWIAAGANPEEVSVRAGHTSVSFTMDRYGHLIPGHDDELRDRLDAMHAAGLERTASGAVVELPTRPAAAPARPTAKQAKRKVRHKTGA